MANQWSFFRLHSTSFYYVLDTIDHPAPSEISFLALPILTSMILINIKQPLIKHLLIPGTALPPMVLVSLNHAVE